MSPRSIRRAAERKAAKLSKRNPKQGEGQPVLTEQQPPKRHATGPITAEGKAISCLNRLKHGLTGSFRVLESESQTQFDELRDTLRAEHAPASATETLLVDRMAEHVWLSQRAQRLQDDELINGSEKTFALFLRYQTTNDRAFFKCLRELAALRRERRQFESQTPESQNAAKPAPPFQSQTPESQTFESQTFESQNEPIVQKRHNASSEEHPGLESRGEQTGVQAQAMLVGAGSNRKVAERAA